MNKKAISVTMSVILLTLALAMGGLMTSWHKQNTSVNITDIVIITSNSLEDVMIEPGSNITSTIWINNTGNIDIPMSINTNITPDGIGFNTSYVLNQTEINDNETFMIQAGSNISMNVTIKTDMKIIPMMYQVETTIL